MAEGPFKDHGGVRLLLLYSETLAHLIYAAADIILVSHTRLLALRCGNI